MNGPDSNDAGRNLKFTILPIASQSESSVKRNLIPSPTCSIISPHGSRGRNVVSKTTAGRSDWRV
eukprot:CAMPEP_0181299300 /NCGR_PEP_ID=MMETSP1101-20121128/6269_1 /TAXON_ID=46948 /ORGANISM="Rhodomonas abbreviata, Strain Caron Lab Isolate" /LENGTH=64 /DNA_ID=CAMNT_0023404433 /DNA_START=539 /DNA_END=733 /DNA_ORIENTATION=-